MNDKIVVSKHRALLDYFVETGICDPDTPIFNHVTPREVEGKHVLGALPLHLCALASKVSILQLNIPADSRGKELSLIEIKQFARKLHHFEVKRVEC